MKFLINLIKNNKIVRYIFSGGMAVFSNLFILYVLVNFYNFYYLIGAIIAFCCGAVVSYLMQKFWTFKDYSNKNITKQFSNFFIYSLFMLGVNTFLMYLCVDIFIFNYLFSQIMITVLTAFVNYFIFSRYMFN